MDGLALRWPDDVGAHDEPDGTYLARLPDGPIHVLEPVAAMIWHASLAGDREGIARRVAAVHGGRAEDYEQRVKELVPRFLRLGLLEEELDVTSGED